MLAMSLFTAAVGEISVRMGQSLDRPDLPARCGALPRLAPRRAQAVLCATGSESLPSPARAHLTPLRAPFARALCPRARPPQVDCLLLSSRVPRGPRLDLQGVQRAALRLGRRPACHDGAPARTVRLAGLSGMRGAAQRSGGGVRGCPPAPGAGLHASGPLCRLLVLYRHFPRLHQARSPASRAAGWQCGRRCGGEGRDARLESTSACRSCCAPLLRATASRCVRWHPPGLSPATE